MITKTAENFITKGWSKAKEYGRNAGKYIADSYKSETYKPYKEDISKLRNYLKEKEIAIEKILEQNPDNKKAKQYLSKLRRKTMGGVMKNVGHMAGHAATAVGLPTAVVGGGAYGVYKATSSKK